MLASAPRPLRALEWRTGETAALAGAASGATPESGATIVVRDPLGIAVGASPAQGSLSIAHEAWRVALAFDGRRTPEELARDLDVPAAAVRHAAEAFSRRLLLDEEQIGRASCRERV